jgi:hypothetical protein
MRRCDTGKFVVLPKRVRRSAPNRRTHHRLAEPVPAPEQGLGMPEPKRHRLPPLGVGSTDAAKALPFMNMILERLLLPITDYNLLYHLAFGVGRTSWNCEIVRSRQPLCP